VYFSSEHRDLHSFPTRRSSDLGRSQDQVLVMPGFYPVVAPTASEAQEKYDYLQSLIQKPVGISILEHTIGVHDLDKIPLDGPVRSEEHTSELQSRSDLVCRLLL